MAKGVNKAILIGHLGKDPEVRYMQSGKAVANAILATGESWKDKNTGERQERTEWHNLVFYSPLAEIAGEYLRKGSQIYVEGRIQTRKWQDREGQDRYTTEIIASSMQMLGSREAGGNRTPEAAPDTSAAAREYADASGGRPPASGPATEDSTEFDDDIPF